MGDDASPSISSVTSKKDENKSLFKTPFVPIDRKRPRLKVLDEDTYVEEMSKIIQRDFFPDLEKLKAQNEFLDATEKKDFQKLRELYIKYSGGQRPPTERYASPATFETPRGGTPYTPANPCSDPVQPEATKSKKTPSSATKDPNMKPLISKNHTLDSYLSTYTSEDNNSFQDLMEDMWERSKAKFAGQLQEEYDSQIKKLTSCEVPSVQEQANHQSKPERLDTWTYKAKNYIMYVPDGEEPQPEIESQKKQIKYSNTRMESDPFDYQRNKDAISQIAKTQEKILSGRIGVDGSTLLDSKKKQGVIVSSSDGADEGIQLISSAHSFVRTPSPCPGAPGETPLMTWGQIEGTPFRLDGGDTPLPFKGSGTSFKMANTSKREQIALALAEKAGQRLRSQKKKALEAAKRSMLTPSPRLSTGSNTERFAMMSPAAQRLASTHLKTHFIGISSPSPKVTSGTPRLTPSMASRSSSKASTPIVARRKTDKTHSGHPEEKRQKKTLTDDLLQINLPKRNRLKAIDFF